MLSDATFLSQVRWSLGGQALVDLPMTTLKRLKNETFLSAILRIGRAFAWPITRAMALVALATVFLLFAERAFSLAQLRVVLPLVYLIPVIVAATRWGGLPAFVAAAVSAATADFLFYDPLYSFWMSDPQQVLDLALFVVVAIVTSNLAGRLRTEADNSRRKEAEVRDLYAFSRRLANCFTAADLRIAIQEFIAEYLGRRLVLIGKESELGGSQPAGAALPPEVSHHAQDMFASGTSTSDMVLDAATGEVWTVRLLSAVAPEYGVIAVNIGDEADPYLEESRLKIEALLSEVTETLSRLNISSMMRIWRARAEADLLKNLLIGSVSHEMGSPLATILGSASILVDVPAVQGDKNLAALAQATHEEALRLNAYVQKVLYATRLGADRAQAKRTSVDVTDLINGAISQRLARLKSHRVAANVAPNLPLVELDPMLIELALSEILENAAKYSPIGGTIAVSARMNGDQIVISVSDEGSGLTPLERSRLFRAPFRGGRNPGSVVGSGLGLWIAHSFVTASGGTLMAASEGESRGTTISMQFAAHQYVLPDLAGCVDD